MTENDIRANAVREAQAYLERISRKGQGILSWKDRTPTLIGHEVKVSRADWLHELKQPEKAEAWKRFCHEWYLVVSDAAIVREGDPSATLCNTLITGPQKGLS